MKEASKFYWEEDVRLRQRHLEWAQTLLRNLQVDGDERGNGSDDFLDGWVDE